MGRTFTSVHCSDYASGLEHLSRPNAVGPGIVRCKRDGQAGIGPSGFSNLTVFERPHWALAIEMKLC